MAEVYVFGDQTADCRAFYTKVFTRKDNILLQTFLEKAAFALQAEIKYRSHASTAVPNFGTIQELVDRYYRQEAKDAAIESALVCISQFSHFIGYVETEGVGWQAADDLTVPSRRSPNHIFPIIQMRDWSVYAPVFLLPQQLLQPIPLQL
jgi:Starter unit:ACP transacylase in aflatoxin biosynthesis